MDDRTWEDFVEDMLLRGRTPDQIWTVAMNTRWVNHANEAREHAARLYKFFNPSKRKGRKKRCRKH
jgi:hypothetical protein